MSLLNRSRPTYFADISANNNGFSAAPYASSGLACVAIKATEGETYTNPHYVEWVRDAHRHGLKVLHYHFCRPESGSPGNQMRQFWGHVAPHFVWHGDKVVLDVETGDPASAATWLQTADAVLKQVSKTHPVCYTYESYLNSGDLRIASNDYWLAAYRSTRPGSRTWQLNGGRRLWAWQYTNGAGFGPGPQRAAGIPGTCDMSQLNPAIVLK